MNDQKIINKGGLGGKDNINGKVQRDLIENKKYYFDYETKPDGINFFNRSKDTIFINQNNRFTKSVKASVIPKFKREDLSFYQKLLKHGTFLLEISILDFFAILFSLFKAFALHMKLMQTSSQYEDLSPYEQFHSTIGFWQPLSVITEIFVICSASLLISDSQTFTQYISLNTQLVFGFSAFLSISTAAQWLHFLPSCYCLVLIIRHAFGKLINVMVGIAPIVISIALVAVFLFGFVGEITESMVKLLESILSVTFGDMISDFYLAFTDGSYIYNILSFIFVSICTATAMWLFFTSFTAQMTSIYLEKVSHIIMGKKKKKDDE
ncbi:hypothetical protein TRFO_37850 [Tritrichomonas foetus]|uniref:Polycystin cation channel PKD1/PKD2 domain-containing protein n=1 Tax=Tritrichomonas foetus TaxID=1144522 RepID=A0A1J4JE98_9EUKA|nr:hypothetical protein TRFO_37850 [Tritrichomonas foetus]|eukprot:OHS95987.1 hypothetical protein TRFO_37850 [Tritrichomonas foetus]